VRALHMRCQWSCMHRAWGVNGTACIVHEGSMTSPAPCMWCHWHRIFQFICIAKPFRIWFSKLFENFIMHAVSRPRIHRACGANDPAIAMHAASMTPKEKYSKTLRIRIYIRKCLSPLNQWAKTNVLMKKTEGRKSRASVPLMYCTVYV
jgi:hypothetical protein